jgi:hypothetical protein
LVEQPIRNRQVSGSSPLVGSILSNTCGQFTVTCCTSYSCLQLIHGVGHNLGHRFDVASLRGADILVAQNCLDHLVRHSEFMKVRG